MADIVGSLYNSSQGTYSYFTYPTSGSGQNTHVIINPNGATINLKSMWNLNTTVASITSSYDFMVGNYTGGSSGKLELYCLYSHPGYSFAGISTITGNQASSVQLVSWTNNTLTISYSGLQTGGSLAFKLNWTASGGGTTYTRVGAPGDVRVGTSSSYSSNTSSNYNVGAPSPGEFYITWTAGSAGTNNAIHGYRRRVIRTSGNAVVDGTTKDINGTSTLYDKTTSWLASAVGNSYKGEVMTLGSVSGYDSTSYTRSTNTVTFTASSTGHTLTANTNGGSPSAGYSYTAATGTKQTIETPTRTNYDFKGWYFNSTTSDGLNYGPAPGTTTSFRIRFWTYATSYAQGTSSTLRAIVSDAEQGGWGLVCEDGTNWSWQVRDTSGWKKVNYARSNLSAGYHTWCLICDLSNKQIKMYIDGTQRGSTVNLSSGTIYHASGITYNVILGNELNTSGGYNTSGSYGFNGYIGNFQIDTGSTSYDAPDLSTFQIPNENATVYAYWTEKAKYTISYNANGGSSTPSSQTKYAGQNIYLASAISKTSTKTTTITTFTTSFNVGSGATAPSSLTSKKTTVTTQPYTFNKWRAGSTTGTSYPAGGLYTADASATMYATWSNGTATTKTTFGSITLPAIPAKSNGSTTTTRTVSYNANGGNSTPSAQSVTPSATITYTDDNNWWTASSGGTNAGGEGATITPSESRTLYAHYTANTGSYSSPTITLPAAITFDPVTTTIYNDGTVNYSAASSVTPSTIEVATIQTQFRLFDKWRLNSTTGASYAAGTTYTPTATSATFYATSTPNGQAETITYSSITLPTVPSKANTTISDIRTVNYNANGGSSTPTAQSVTSTATVTWSDDDKWYTSEIGGTGYTQGTSYTPTARTTTLYANYEPSTGTYSSPTLSLRGAISKAGTTVPYPVIFDTNGSSTANTTKTTTLNVSYTFDKWRLGSTTGTSYSAGATFTPTVSSTTMYATFNQNEVADPITTPTAPTARPSATVGKAITFNPNGGSVTSTSTNTVITNSWKFGGWATTTSATTGIAVNTSFTPTTTRYYASWTTNTITASSISTPIPTRAGYVCTGWYTSASGGTKRANAGGSYTPPTTGETVYAQWTRQGASRNMYVYNGSAWKVATPYVFNGSQWKRATAYVFNGSEWKQSSTFPD